MKNRIVCILAAGAALGMVGSASADTITSNILFGDGVNINDSFTIDRNVNAGIELGLRGKLRYDANGQPQDTFNQNLIDGTIYNFAPGFAHQTPISFYSDRGEWSFEWSINTNYNGGGANLGALDTNGDPIYTFLLGIDENPTQGTTFNVFDPINDLNPNYGEVRWDHGIGTNFTATGAGDDQGYVNNTSNYSTALNNNHVAQNSWQPQWFMTTFDPTIPGTYDFFLEAFENGSSVARTEIQIVVGQGGAAVVPIPAAAPLGLLGMGLVAFVRRRKNAKA